MPTDLGAGTTDGALDFGLHFTTLTDTEVDHDDDPNTATIDLSGKGTRWSIGEGAEARAEDRAGNWGGTFFDNADADADDETADRNDGTPGYAVGEFSAEYGTIGRMLGAFGTSNSELDRDPQ